MADMGASMQAVTAGRPVDVAPPIAGLHVITPDSVDARTLAVVCDLVGAGVPWIQVRLKSASDRDRLAFTAEVVAACARAGAASVVDDRCDLVLATGATGVHVGADDLPVPVARKILGDRKVVGATARDPDSARAAEDAGASYIGAGPAYRSTSKERGLPEPIGPSGIERIAHAVSIPVIAIAGITRDRVGELLDAGASGVAVIAAVFMAPDPVAAALDLLELAGASHLSGRTP